MNALKIRKATYYVVNYSDLENFINNHYGRNDFSFVADQLCQNDSSVSLSVDGELDEFDLEDLKDFTNGKPDGFVSRVILNDLASKGKIPTGEYIIEVCW